MLSVFRVVRVFRVFRVLRVFRALKEGAFLVLKCRTLTPPDFHY